MLQQFVRTDDLDEVFAAANAVLARAVGWTTLQRYAARGGQQVWAGCCFSLALGPARLVPR
jgi:hypothetical protein